MNILVIIARAIREVLGKPFAEALGYQIGSWIADHGLEGVLARHGFRISELEVEAPSPEPFLVGMAKALLERRIGKVKVLANARGTVLVRYEPPTAQEQHFKRRRAA